MENESNVRSEEALGRLRGEGKISDTEYQELLESMNKPVSQSAKPPVVAEPQFEAFRIRVLTGSLALCIVGLPIGLILDLPYVWILSILGMIVAPVKLGRIKGSWMAKLMNKYK